MLKQLLVGGAVIAGLAGVAFAAPAQADKWPKPSETERNISAVTGNVAVCGNRGIGDITVALLNFNPVTSADNESTGCNVTVNQQ
ncbi:hypothetical protein AB0B45_30520 [Nonomuraea sp. NPDC049152]|uniref:hypothetical protein n=1 Tax=Nonomuraea sp. NPDC049152 TaxID=3154350 RepID=UPI0033CA5FD4